MLKNFRTLILVAGLLLFLCLPSAGQTQVDFPGNRHSAELFDANSANLTSPVAAPPSAIHWKWERTRAREIMEARFPKSSQVVAPIRVIPDDPEARVETVPEFRFPQPDQSRVVYQYICI